LDDPELYENDSNIDSIKQWEYDSNGGYVKKLIVDPLFDYVLDSLKDYVKRIEHNTYNKKQDIIITAITLISLIKGKSMHMKLLKTIAPFFYIQKDKYGDILGTI
jgi:hypothetical protein